MNNQATYKRKKINRVVIFVFVIYGIIYVHMTFAYIYQWGNNPIDRTGYIIFATILAVVLLFVWFLGGRLKIIIDNDYFILRSDAWVPVRVPIDKIENVSIERFGLMEVPKFWKNDKKYQFDIVKQAVGIHLKNGKNYYITIKNAQEIKEEIEKRMNKTSIE